MEPCGPPRLPVVRAQTAPLGTTPCQPSLAKWECSAVTASLPSSLQALCHPINCGTPPQSPPSPQAMQSPIPTQPGQNKSVTHSTSHTGTGHGHTPSPTAQGAGMKHPQKPPCPRTALQEPSQLPAAPAPLSSCRTSQVLQTVGRAPKGCHGAAPPNWGPTAEPKAAAGFKAGQEGGQVSPSQGRGPGRVGRHMGCRD